MVAKKICIIYSNTKHKDTLNLKEQEQGHMPPLKKTKKTQTKTSPQILDLRSSIVKDVSCAVSLIARGLGTSFDPETVLDSLFKQVVVSIAVVKESAHECTLECLTYSPTTRVLPMLQESAQSKSVLLVCFVGLFCFCVFVLFLCLCWVLFCLQQRKLTQIQNFQRLRTSEYYLCILESWPSSILDKVLPNICDVLKKKVIVDADSNVKQNGRMCVKVMLEKSPHYAQSLINSLDQTIARHLQVHSLLFVF